MVDYPANRSRSGDNQYYHRCKPVKRSRHYGICLFTLEAYEKGIELQEAACVKAIKKKTCPALAMRAEEAKAGKALYFIPMKAVEDKPTPQEEAVNRKTIDPRHPSYRRGQALVKGARR